MTVIEPTVGRMVHFHQGKNAGTGRLACNPGCVLAAIVCHVHDSRLVNVCVYDANGNPHDRTSVILVQPDDECPDCDHCQWMPFQKGQAGKTDMLVEELTVKLAALEARVDAMHAPPTQGEPVKDEPAPEPAPAPGPQPEPPAPAA